MANPKIQLRHDTAANWASVNPVLLEGEVGVETDTNKQKVGDGTTVWNDLPYLINYDSFDLPIQKYVAQTGTTWDETKLVYNSISKVFTPTDTVTSGDYAEKYPITFNVPSNINIDSYNDSWALIIPNSVFTVNSTNVSNLICYEIYAEDGNIISRLWYGASDWRRGMTASTLGSMTNRAWNIQHFSGNAVTCVKELYAGFNDLSQGCTFASTAGRINKVVIYVNSQMNMNVPVGNITLNKIDSSGNVLEEYPLFTKSTQPQIKLSYNSDNLKINNNNQLDTVVNFTDVATAAQGALADSALQSGDNVSELNNDANYLSGSSAVTPLSYKASGISKTIIGSIDSNGYLEGTTSSVEAEFIPETTIASQIIFNDVFSFNSHTDWSTDGLLDVVFSEPFTVGSTTNDRLRLYVTRYGAIYFIIGSQDFIYENYLTGDSGTYDSRINLVLTFTDSGDNWTIGTGVTNFNGSTWKYGSNNGTCTFSRAGSNTATIPKTAKIKKFVLYNSTQSSMDTINTSVQIGTNVYTINSDSAGLKLSYNSDNLTVNSNNQLDTTTNLSEINNKVSKSGDTMTGKLTVPQLTLENDSYARYITKCNSWERGTNPSEDMNCGLIIEDKNSSGVAAHRFGEFVTQVNSDGQVYSSLKAWKNETTNTNTSIQIGYKADGTVFTYAPACNLNNSIVTTVSHTYSSANNTINAVKFGNGLIINWGRVNLNGVISASNKVITFAIPYTTNAKVVASRNANAGQNVPVVVGWENTTSFNIGCPSESSTGYVNFIAIGY